MEVMKVLASAHDALRPKMERSAMAAVKALEILLRGPSAFHGRQLDPMRVQSDPGQGPAGTAGPVPQPLLRPARGATRAGLVVVACCVGRHRGGYQSCVVGQPHACHPPVHEAVDRRFAAVFQDQGVFGSEYLDGVVPGLQQYVLDGLAVADVDGARDENHDGQQ